MAGCYCRTVDCAQVCLWLTGCLFPLYAQLAVPQCAAVWPTLHAPCLSGCLCPLYVPQYGNLAFLLSFVIFPVDVRYMSVIRPVYVRYRLLFVCYSSVDAPVIATI